MQKNKATVQQHNYIFNKIKPVVLFIFSYKCVLCKSFSYSNHIHHIDKNHYNNNPFNLTCLCESCHILIHSNIKFKLPQLDPQQKKLLNKLLQLIRKSV